VKQRYMMDEQWHRDDQEWRKRIEDKLDTVISLITEEDVQKLKDLRLKLKASGDNLAAAVATQQGKE
jgi:hypothetical protein